MVAEYRQLGNGTWSERTQCSGINLAAVIGGTVGGLVFAGFCVIIAVIVLINVNEYRALKRFEAELERLKSGEHDYMNPIYKERPQMETTVMNPMSEMK